MDTAKNIEDTENIEGHEIELPKLLMKLSTSPKTGLSDSEVERRKEIYGLNVIPKVKRSLWQVYIAPLLEVLIVMYLIMTGVLVFLSFWDETVRGQAVQWLFFVALNFAIAIVQQYRAQKKIDALQKLTAPSSRVIRNGKTIEIPSDEIVPGDIIELRQGDRIPADARIIEANNLQVNEASLTGESVPVTKVEDGNITLEKDIPLSERKNMLYSGTFVQFGSARAVVVKTGANTEIGKISRELAELNTGEIPLRKKVNQLGKYLTALMVVFLTVSLVYRISYILQKSDLSQSELAQHIGISIITAMSVMPINIPLLTTVVLVTGVLAMASYKVIIRNLSAVESLGRISILCSDKTGTITTSEMTVKYVWDGTQLYGVTGLGYEPKGTIFPIKDEQFDISEVSEEDLVAMATVKANPTETLKLILINGFLNNTAELIPEKITQDHETIIRWRSTGSATDAALLALFKKSDLSEEEIKQQYTKIREYPFDSSLKRMSMLFKGPNGYIVFTKGATEVILPRCTKVKIRNEIFELNDEKRKEIDARVTSFAQQGYRVISFAYKLVDSIPEKDEKERDKVENDLIYLGFTCIFDPPREGVKKAVSECWSAGVTPIMITGDSPITAASIAKEVGILRPGEKVYEGRAASELDDEEFEKTRVFARVAPKDKQIIVERYQKKNRVVGMTGDGVNDALALSMADAGIVMGITGTDVAKQAGDIIITDDSFVSIVEGIRQGRSLFQKIRMMVLFYIAVNLAEAMVYMGSSFILLPSNLVLLDNWQRAYIFGIVHAIPPLALIFDRISADIMKRKPIDTAGIFNWKLVGALLVTSLPLAAILYFVYYGTMYQWLPIFAVREFNKIGFNPIFKEGTSNILRPVSWEQAKARTMFMTIIYITEPLFVLSIRRIDKPIYSNFTDKSERFWFVYLMIFSMPVLHITLMYLPVLQEIVRSLSSNSVVADIIFLDPLDWLVCIGLGLIPILTLEIYKKWIRSQGEYF